MKFHKNAIFAIASILAVCVLTPQLHAQLAPPAQPVTAGDAKEFNEARALFEAQKWKEARTALQNFVDKYKMFSPHSRDAKLMLAVVSIQSKEFEMGVKQLRDLIGDKSVQPEAKSMAQLTIAKALTMLAFDRFPITDTAAQKGAQKKALENALAEYDAFFTMFPKSKDADSAYFLKGQVLVAMGSYDLSVPEFGNVLQKFPNSPLKWDAQIWIGKGQFIYASSLLYSFEKDKKEVPPADVKRAMDAYDNAEKALVATYQGSGDVALQNEATFFMGQMQLARHRYVTGKEKDKVDARKRELQEAALQAFRAVRSVEEVVDAQEQKIKRLEQAMQLNAPGTPDYMERKNRIENLIGIETEKVDKYKTGQDQYLAARMAIARIFLFLEKNDECRVLLRALQMQKEALEKDKEAPANVAAMLCLTYAAQYRKIVEAKNKESAHKCAEKSLETYEAFRAAFKGNDAGENLPLLVANVLLDDGKAEKAEEIINQGMTDYKDWPYAADALRIQCGIALKKGDYAKALELVEKVLSSPLKEDVEAEMTSIKGNILREKGKEEGNAVDIDKALLTFVNVREKFAKYPCAEDAWFAIGQIHSEREPAKAKPELEGFIAKFADGGGKSSNTDKNVPLAQYLLAKVLRDLGEKDPKSKEAAILAYRKILEKWPESEVGPNVLFKIFEIYNEKPDYQMCLKLMEEFVAKYPSDENVYFAYSNMAELLFTGSLNTKTTPEGKTVSAGAAGIKDLEKGTSKLNSYVDYELAQEKMKVKRGDSALLKIADKWLEELRKMPSFMVLSPEQKLAWQKCVDNVITAIERQLKTYPKGTRLGEGLERLVKLQSLRLKAQQADAAQVETYFKDLAAKYGTDPLLKAKIQAKLAEFLFEVDPKRGFSVVGDAFQTVPNLIKENEVVLPTFSPLDYDRYLTGLYEAKRHDEVVKVLKRLADEYPMEGGTAPVNVTGEAQAVILYWEGKEMQEKGNNAGAGEKFSKLAKDYPKSAKKMEADYGVILGDLERGTMKEEAQLREALQRLAEIVKVSNTKTFDLQAKALFLMGRVYEELKDYDGAVGAYLKIADRFESVQKIAGDGLWKGAQILEKQAKGEIKVLTPIERKAANDKAAEATKAAAEKVKAEAEKLNPSKAKDPKAAAGKDAKPGAAKDTKAPADKNAKPEAAKEAKAPADKDAKSDAAKEAKPAEKPETKPEAKPAEVTK
jgi:tetratricopeptide (TPR) repeat protein